MSISKICVKCHEEKPFTTDYFHKHIISGIHRHRSASCIACHKKRMKIANKRGYKKYREKALIRQYTKIDTKQGFRCDLTEQWFKENLSSQPCTYCGTTKRPIGADRIDNTKGHTLDNCIPCCKICNKVRNNIFTVEEMKKIGKVISEFTRL